MICCFVIGLLWDGATNSVYLSTGVDYNVDRSNHPALLRAALDDAAHTIATAGPWKSPGGPGYPGHPNNSMIQGGATPIPRWFADAHLGAGGSRHLALGFGGIISGAGFNSCDRANGWVGIVYRRAGVAADSTFECGVSSPVPEKIAYKGPCRSGWIADDVAEVIAG